MSDAPERIWAGPDDNAKGWGLLRRGEDVFWEDPENSTPEDRSGLSEYVRADTSNALVAAAYEAAASACDDYPRSAPEEAEWMRYDEQIEYSQRVIRALTPADAQAALDTLVAEKVREAMTNIVPTEMAEALIAHDLHKALLTTDRRGWVDGLSVPLNPDDPNSERECVAHLDHEDSQIGPRLWDFAISALKSYAACRDQKEPKG